MRDLDFSRLEPLSRPARSHRRRWLALAVVWTVALCAASAAIARANDFQCAATECKAYLPGSGWHKFRRGDLLGTSGGWIFNERDGWVPADFNAAIAGLLPLPGR